eukprot:jgi/Chrzof1/3708/Cz13g06020.t1
MPRKVGNTILKDEEIRELKELFDMVDKDKGGSLSAEEVQELMEILGMPRRLEDVERMIADIDKDNSQTVDFDEFLQVVAKPQQLPYSRADLLRSFRLFADVGSPAGCIAPETLEKALVGTTTHGSQTVVHESSTIIVFASQCQ